MYGRNLHLKISSYYTSSFDILFTFKGKCRFLTDLRSIFLTIYISLIRDAERHRILLDYLGETNFYSDSIALIIICRWKYEFSVVVNFSPPAEPSLIIFFIHKEDHTVEKNIQRETKPQRIWSTENDKSNTSHAFRYALLSKATRVFSFLEIFHDNRTRRIDAKRLYRDSLNEESMTHENAASFASAFLSLLSSAPSGPFFFVSPVLRCFISVSRLIYANSPPAVINRDYGLVLRKLVSSVFGAHIEIRYRAF